jgi:ubiquinol-cytochrome c reductase iron-sulfur subunit
MPALASTTRAIARTWVAHQLPVARASSAAMQTRSATSDAHASSSFDSPFKGAGSASKIPDFSAYRSKGGETGTRVFSYFMVGTMGALASLGAKATVQGRWFLRDVGKL